MTSPAALQRVICYVDGFNLYHGLKEHSKARKYRWLNLRSLAASQLKAGHSLIQVIYFTSIPPWNHAKGERHRTYIAALKTVDVEVVEGRFQKEVRECYATCKLPFDYFTEKLTDVHISTRILNDAVNDRFDWAYLVSGDADQVPTILTLRQIAPQKNVHVIFPPRRHSTHLETVAASHTRELGHRDVKHHQFPDQIHTPSRTIQKPKEWYDPPLP